MQHPKLKLKSYLDSNKQNTSREFGNGDREEDDSDLDFLTAEPIAELFPNCTVLFADISGFSAWSSEREPEQVFTLLETIFQTMDRLARRKTVFKVETIGDSYMAVTGLPGRSGGRRAV